MSDICLFFSASLTECSVLKVVFFSAGTIPPIRSARGEGDDVKKLFSIGSPVILVTLGVALLFIIRKKRKEKRLKRLRGEREGKGVVQAEIGVIVCNEVYLHGQTISN